MAFRPALIARGGTLMLSVRNVLRASVGIAISVAAVYLTFQAVAVESTWHALFAAQPSLAGLTIGLLLADIGVRAVRWQALLWSVRRIRLLSVFGHLLVGYVANNVFPARLGELVRSISLGDREGLSRSTVVGSIVAERLLDVAVLAAAVAVGVLLVPSAGFLTFAAVSGAVVGAGGLGLVYLLSKSGLPTWVPFFAKVEALTAVMRGLRQGVAVVRSPRSLASATALTGAAWVVTTGAFLVAGRAVGLELGFGEALLFAAGINLATAIPAGPGYLGTFELAALAVAAAIGVPAEPALAMTILVHVATLSVTTLGGVLALAALYVLPITTRRRAQLATVAVADDSPATTPEG